MDAAQAFRELVTTNSCKQAGQNALLNITFFVGAGNIFTASEGFVDWIKNVMGP
jgi:hypothetical protein